MENADNWLAGWLDVFSSVGRGAVHLHRREKEKLMKITVYVCDEVVRVSVLFYFSLSYTFKFIPMCDFRIKFTEGYVLHTIYFVCFIFYTL